MTKPDLNTMDMRERLIIAQALVVAIDTLKKVPQPYQEVSNIMDMEHIVDYYFGEWWGGAEHMVKDHHKMMERITTGQLTINQENN